MEKNLYYGTSGLLLPVPNKQYYPPEFRDKSRLTYYSSLFNSIEINSSFYKVPMARTVKNWAESVPEEFKFSFKLWREITHQKGFSFDPEEVIHFLKVIDEVGAQKKGCLLVQFPPSIGANFSPQLTQLLHTIREADPENSWKISLEFRHASWYREMTYELMQDFNAGLVIHDKPGSASPMLSQDTDFIYLRFHGPKGDYKGGYEDDFLAEYATYIQEWISEGKTVFVYFNNTAGEAIHNLETLKTEVQLHISSGI